MFDFDYCAPMWRDGTASRWMSWPSVALRDTMMSVVAASAMASALTLRLTPHSGHVEIDLIAVGGADRGHGIGSWTLSNICSLADLHGVDIRLQASSLPWPGKWAMTDDELVAWYGRHGFELDDRGDGLRWMVRRHGGRAGTEAAFGNSAQS